MNVCFFAAGFSVILNGLDNLEARRHVNRLAMAADVPLVESGTAGYLGQVQILVSAFLDLCPCAPGFCFPLFFCSTCSCLFHVLLYSLCLSCENHQIPLLTSP